MVMFTSDRGNHLISGDPVVSQHMPMILKLPIGHPLHMRNKAIDSFITSESIFPMLAEAAGLTQIENCPPKSSEDFKLFCTNGKRLKEVLEGKVDVIFTVASSKINLV